MKLGAALIGIGTFILIGFIAFVALGGEPQRNTLLVVSVLSNCFGVASILLRSERQV